jgi:hypothetical protein
VGLRIIRVVTAAPDHRGATEAVEYDADSVVIRRLPEGVTISGKPGRENTLGFISLFHPWVEVRQIKEFDRA